VFRITDRFDRKLADKLDLDPHETVISKLQDRLIFRRSIGLGNKNKVDNDIPVINY
jgi:hypothetical protein